MLDPGTMLFMTALTTAAGGLLLLACCRRAGSSAMLVWALAMIVAAVGLVLAAIGSGHRTLESVATATLLLGSGLFWTATRLFRGMAVRWDWLAAGPGVWLATTALHSDSALWVAGSCLAGSSYTMASVRELWLTRKEGLPSWGLAVTLMAGHAGVYVARAGLAGWATVWPAVATPGWVAPAMITEALVHIYGTSLVLVALLLERHERRMSQSLQLAAYVDGLTGIANRRRFEEQLAALSVERGRSTAMVGLILLDLDHFKSINDVAGHDEGDRVLRAVAQVIAGQVRSASDLLVRYGGEEFAVLLRMTSLPDAYRVAERIRCAVVDAAIPHAGKGGIVTVSGGVEVMPAADLARLRDVLTRQADQALYEAKRRGRNRIVRWSELAAAREVAAAPTNAARLPSPPDCGVAVSEPWYELGQ